MVLIIIVEGPDGGGKTTLIKTLSERLNLPVAPRVVNKDTRALVNLRVWTEQNVSQGFQPIIFDRHRLISEPIYGSILRREFEPGFDDAQWLYEQYLRFYEFCDPIIIFCLPPYWRVLKNIEDDPDNTAVVARIRRIYSLYTSLTAREIALRPDSTFWYDYTSAPYREDILRAIEKRVSNVKAE